jgi:hypothetical protein
MLDAIQKFSERHLIAKKRELSEQTGRDVAMLCCCCDCRSWKLYSEPSELLANYKIMGWVQKVLDRTQSCEPKLCLLSDLELWYFWVR